MSYAGAVFSTRAVVDDPSGRRIVTVDSAPTTCTLVRIVSADTKKPLPRAVGVWIVITAEFRRATRSSSAGSGGSALGSSAGAGSAAKRSGASTGGAGGAPPRAPPPPPPRDAGAGPAGDAL